MDGQIEYCFVSAYSQLVAPFLGEAVAENCLGCCGECEEHFCKTQNFVQQIRDALPMLWGKVSYADVLEKFLEFCQNAWLTADDVDIRVFDHLYFEKLRRDPEIRNRVIHNIRCLLDSGARG